MLQTMFAKVLLLIIISHIRITIIILNFFLNKKISHVKKEISNRTPRNSGAREKS